MKSGHSWRIIRAVIVLVMLGGLVYVAKPARLWETLRGANWNWVLAGVPFGFAAIFCDALKLYYLIVPHGYSGGWKSVFRTTMVVNFASLFLPGTVGGGAVMWYRLSKPDGLRAQSFTAVAFNALLKLVVICGLGAAALSADALADAEHKRIALPLAILGLAAAIAFVCVTMTGFAAWFSRVIFQRFSKLMPGFLHGPITKIIESADTYRQNKGSVIAAFGAGVGRKLIENFCFLFALRAVGADVGYWRVLWVMCAVEASGMIPLTLSGWGLPQVTFVGLLAAFGVASDVSLAGNIIAFAILLPVYAAGGFALLGESVKREPAEGGS